MEQKQTSIFREANLKKASEPEKLDGYLKVTGFGPWLVLLAAGLIMAAFIVWMFMGRLQAGVTSADIEGSEGHVTALDDRLYAASEIPNNVLYMLPDSRWYCTVEVDCSLEDGLYTAVFLNEVRPASYIIRGE